LQLIATAIQIEERDKTKDSGMGELVEYLVKENMV